MYRGCPTCRILERRGYGHAYGIAEWLFKLKLIVKDTSDEMEVTAWETAEQIVGMDLDEFVAVHVRVESEALLKRSTEAPCTPARMVVPPFSLTAGVTSDSGMASIPTRREGEHMDLKSGIRNPHFRSGLFIGFCAGLLTRGLVYIVALDAHAVCLLAFWHGF
ncbi:hypothetical protein R1sor_009562 [Riccia sorocarpa]|uniref:Uncharacterized protein n=1 Tax=Riccia sorocarpa TaxID=122646 RepID=A0ABD3HZK7_9MARC